MLRKPCSPGWRVRKQNKWLLNQIFLLVHLVVEKKSSSSISYLLMGMLFKLSLDVFKEIFMSKKSALHWGEEVLNLTFL